MVDVGRTVVELETEKVQEGPYACCVGSVDCGIKSERVGSIEGFKNTLENASAITF